MKRLLIISLHVGYWLLYFSLVTTVVSSHVPIEMMKSLANLHDKNSSVTLIALIDFSIFSLIGVAAIVPGVIGFYTFYFLLFSKYLKQKKLIQFFIFAVLSSISSAVLTQLIMYVKFKPPVYQINWCFNTCFYSGLLMAFITIVHGVIGLIMKGSITWFEEIKMKDELHKKNQAMELALIKSHINPHFLFNTINNIDVLIEKDATKASAYLNKLSDIMRFMLYETKEEKIPLEKELEYIQKYIDLQKIRTSNSAYINFLVEGPSKNLTIAPMLFIPFIENAFKHSESKKTENGVKIRFNIEKDKITFECENNYGKTVGIKEDSGLGNELIKKRLLLLYPGKHNLEITDDTKNYKVKLVLDEN